MSGVSDKVPTVLTGDKLYLITHAMDLFCEKREVDFCTFSNIGEWEVCSDEECSGDFELRFTHTNESPPGRLKMLLACKKEGADFGCKLFQELHNSVDDTNVRLIVKDK